MHAQTLTDYLTRSTIAATCQLLGNVLVEVLTQGDASVLHLSLLIQGLNPILPIIGIYLTNIGRSIGRNSEKHEGKSPGPHSKTLSSLDLRMGVCAMAIGAIAAFAFLKFTRDQFTAGMCVQ
jgi:hypothetical protein